MNIDDFFRKANKLEAPEALRDKVMEEIEKSTPPLREPGWIGKPSKLVTLRRIVAPLAAAAVLFLAIRLIPEQERVEVKSAAKNADELALFVENALNPVFSHDITGGRTGDVDSDNLDSFVENTLESVFNTNPGEVENADAAGQA